MTKCLLFIASCSCFLHSSGQDKWTSSFLQAGASFNFLNTYAQLYDGSLGGETSYEIENLKPLPGFEAGFLSERKIHNRIFFRSGILLSYHVNSATMNSSSAIQGFQISQSANIKTRFRNLYAQCPVEIGFYIGRKNSLGIFGGLKGSLLIANAGKWSTTTITRQYPPDPTLKPDTSNQIMNHEFNSLDVALELGFTERLSGHFVLEERAYKGLAVVSRFTSGTYAPALKQFTIEVSIGWKLNQHEKQQ